jgi:hypothetical protein
MFRKFKFEESLYDGLTAIPLSTLYKLDAVGLELSPEIWRGLPEEERRVLCHLSVRSLGEKNCYNRYVLHLLRRAGESPVFLEPEKMKRERSEWENPVRIPTAVHQQAVAAGFAMAQEDWLKMDDLERYALFKLSGEKRDAERFGSALREFLPYFKPSRVTETF